ncbi:hypothetical protein, partial [Nonomuraea typhae]|uniref:hypothetical protein n=1 Tax=Nonomuraea typhae TaxID=2603600 RepID=UPI001CA4976F
MNAAALPCVPDGPTAADEAKAAALNPLLQNKMRGHMNGYNTSCARVIVSTVKNRGLNERAAAIAIATVIVESSIANLDHGDLDSVGLYQQRAIWGGSVSERTDPVWATNSFLDKMQQFYPNGSWNTAPIGDVAADVQRPAAQYRYRYGVEANDAVIITDALWTGSGPGSVSGDGRAEVVLVESSGNLKAWYNGRGFTNTPWTSDTSIGNGFTDPSRVRF